MLPTVQSLINSLFRGPALVDGVRRVRSHHRHGGRARAVDRIGAGGLVRLAGGVPDQPPAGRGRRDRRAADGARDPRPRRWRRRRSRSASCCCWSGWPDWSTGWSRPRGPAGSRRPPTPPSVPIAWGIDAPVSIGFASLLIGVVVLVIFVVVERVRGAAGKPTLVDLTLFSIPSFSSGSLAVLVVALGEFGILFLLPLYLQVGRGLSPLQAQLVVLPTALGSFISAPLTATRKTVPARTWVLFGLALEVVGLVLLAVAISPAASVLWMALTAAGLRHRRGLCDQPADRRHPARSPDEADRAGQRPVQHGPPAGFGRRGCGADGDPERGAGCDARRPVGHVRPGDSGGGAGGRRRGDRQQSGRPGRQRGVRDACRRPAWPACRRRPNPAWHWVCGSRPWPRPCRSPGPGSWRDDCPPRGRVLRASSPRPATVHHLAKEARHERPL